MASISATTAGDGSLVNRGLRIVTLSTAAVALLFAVNNYLIFWQGWPGIMATLGQLGWPGATPPPQPLAGGALVKGWLQLLSYPGGVAVITAYVLRHPRRTMTADAEILSSAAAYIARAAFWSVLLIGLADMVLSFLRVENLLPAVVGQHLATDLGRPAFRGESVHYPLIGLSLIIAMFSRSLGFIWLSLLIVLAEFQIVVARFIFSYEQAFMADLVRFWYGGLFLFASAYTLLEEGHVRVDILYTTLSDHKKAWCNTVGCFLLGVPLCWVILATGMWNRSDIINAPLLSFEVTQSGFGMYVKYLMAGFLLVYALTMMVQFLSYILRNVALLVHEPDAVPVGTDGHGGS